MMFLSVPVFSEEAESEYIPKVSSLPWNFKRKIHQKEFGILVIKSKFRLYVLDKQFKVIESIPAAIGMNPDTSRKIYEGDKRTPEGLYHITRIFSTAESEDSDSYKIIQKLNTIYYKAEDGNHHYTDTNKDLGTALYGPRFFEINYPSYADKKRYKRLLNKKEIPQDEEGLKKIGYGIGIHGTNDEMSVGMKSTNGCMVLKNDDVVKLDRYIRIGTPVLIVSSLD